MDLDEKELVVVDLEHMDHLVVKFFSKVTEIGFQGRSIPSVVPVVIVEIPFP